MTTSRSDLPQYKYIYERPAPDIFGLGQCLVDGMEYTSNGSQWFARPIILQSVGKAYMVPSLAAANAATYTQSGTTITVTSTSHTLTNARDGADVYLAIADGLATAGWYSNFTYVNANSFTCTSTISQTTSGTVNSNTSATTITPLSYVLPGGSMGPNGVLEVWTLVSMTGSTNTKTINSLLGSSNIKNIAHAGSVVGSSERRLVSNRNNQAKQALTNVNIYEAIGGTTSAMTTLTIDTAVNQTISHKLTVAAANEFACMEHVQLILYPAS